MEFEARTTIGQNVSMHHFGFVARMDNPSGTTGILRTIRIRQEFACMGLMHCTYSWLFDRRTKPTTTSPTQRNSKFAQHLSSVTRTHTYVHELDFRRCGTMPVSLNTKKGVDSQHTLIAVYGWFLVYCVPPARHKHALFIDLSTLQTHNRHSILTGRTKVNPLYGLFRSKIVLATTAIKTAERRYE